MSKYDLKEFFNNIIYYIYEKPHNIIHKIKYGYNYGDLADYDLYIIDLLINSITDYLKIIYGNDSYDDDELYKYVNLLKELKQYKIDISNVGDTDYLFYNELSDAEKKKLFKKEHQQTINISKKIDKTIKSLKNSNFLDSLFSMWF